MGTTSRSVRSPRRSPRFEHGANDRPKWRAHVLAGTTPRERQTRMRALPIPRVSKLLVLSDDAEEAVLFIGDSGGEENSVGERQKIPQAIELEWSSIGAHERLDEIPGDRIIVVDQAVTEIANPQFVAFHQSKSPRGVEIPV